MNTETRMHVYKTKFDRQSCDIGVVHLGYGAFHRAHQAVYLDDYMEHSGDLRWGVAAVNLRHSEYEQFKTAASDTTNHDGYFLKSYSSNGQVELRKVRSHVAFHNWKTDTKATQNLLALNTVHLVTITVTESGYYTDPNGNVNLDDTLIQAEVKGAEPQSVYGYLRAALRTRIAADGAPLTIACCDNIRQNGKMMHRNLLAYLDACNDTNIANWVRENVEFPCSMVDRITPRATPELSAELSGLIGSKVSSPIMAEDFTQWVLQDSATGAMPDLGIVGVIVTPDVDPYEETKIRVLNGGHTALAYLAAIEGVETFDAAMRIPHLLAHFKGFETQEVLPALNFDLPFSKEEYLNQIEQRFSNQAIGDTVARICADGMAKFPIFIRPTLEGCLAQGIVPTFAIKSIASWHQFAQHVNAGKIDFEYIEPSWNELRAMLGKDDFLTSRQLWGDLPETYPAFVENLRRELSEMEQKWPV
jgi:mannitol-1-phosphate/altronate dehydrogenase